MKADGTIGGMRPRILVGGVLGAALIVAVAARAQDAPPEEPSPEDFAAEIAAKETELSAVAEKIRTLKDARTKKTTEQARLTDVVETLEDHARQARLELDHTTLTIDEVRIRIRQNTDAIQRLTRTQTRLRTQLSELLRTLAAFDRRSPLEMLALQGTFADFLGVQHAVARIQARTTALILETDDARRTRAAREQDLAARRDELQDLAKLQAAQRASLETQEQQQRGVLSRTVQEAARLASQLAEAEEARREIQQEVFVLRNAGLRLSLKQAEDYARYAGGATGVRPALLLGVLKIESNVGTNVGGGRYPDDVHPGHREAFLRVAEKLGLNPHTTPVSAKPTTYEGWGGALGPGQIMPGTWERIERAVARIIGKPVASPFELLDAFVGTAVILRSAGAAGGNEYEAVNRYFAGPNWARFTWYGDRVLAVAKEYESRWGR